MAIKTALDAAQREQLHQAILRACTDPYSWPQDDKCAGYGRANFDLLHKRILHRT